MLFVSDLPNLRISKQKTRITVDDKLSTLHSVVFLNTNNANNLASIMTNTLIYHNNKFHDFFTDAIYKGKIASHSYRAIYTKEREMLYSDIETKVKFINTHPNLTSVNGKNLFFDLSKYNIVFFDFAKKMKYQTKSKEYISYLSNIINSTKMDGYNYKTMIINVDDWYKDTVKLDVMNLDNPIFMMYYSMQRDFDTFKTLGNIDIVLYSGNSVIRVNPSQCDGKSFAVFRREIAKLHPKLSELENEEKINNDIKKNEVFNDIVGKFSETYRFVGYDDDNPQVDESIKQRLEEITEETKMDDIPEEELNSKLTTKLINDEQLLKRVYQINQQKVTGRTTESLKRDSELREKQKELTLSKMSLDQIKSLNSRDVKIEVTDVSDKVTTINKNVTKVKFPNFEKAYNENVFKKDLVNAITHLNERSIPIFVRKIDVENTSDELNLKETYNVELEDSNRVRHHLKFDIPIFLEDKFMYLRGNKKLIVKQLLMKPIVKTGPDEVQICSASYNKIFIRRYGAKVSSKIEKLKKALLKPIPGITVKFGNNLAINNKYKSVIEYDELSKDFTYIKTGKCEFYFNQDEVQGLINKNGWKLKDDQMCIGMYTDGKAPIILNTETQMIDGATSYDIVDYIVSIDSGKLKTQFDDETTGKKFVYSRATIMKKQVPVVLLLGYVEGLSNVLRKASIKYQFSDKRPKIDITNQGVVQFADGYLIYDKYPFENSLLMNAFADIPTRAFNYEDFDSKEAYLSIFDIMFQNKLLGNAFDNFYEFMIDPITKEVLEDLNYPTDFVSVILFANKLLADNAFLKENNMNIYRVRSNEIVNSILYKAIADAYNQYRITAYNNNPVKVSIPQDTVIKKLLTLQTVEDYSTLNPIVELEKSRAITPKGWIGMNLDDAYTQDKRSYDKSMLGVLAMSTSPDANCGVVRQLALEPNITSVRGYLDLKDDQLDKLTDANLFSPAELLSPLGGTRDDAVRTAMATKQSKHIIPIQKASPVLISNGAESIAQYHLSNDFTVIAKQDGQVVEYDNESGIVMVQYKDNSVQAIDIHPKIVKNGAGGFFLSNQLACDLKKGQKFKKNDTLAYDKHFFTNSAIHGNRFNIGSLQKIMCMSTYATYEDSTEVTNKLANDMAAEIVMQKPVTLGKNSNVDYIVNIGDKIQVGDELIRFETSFEEDTLNKFLASVGDSLKEEIKALGKTPVKSKYSGVIEDIKVYSTVDLEELSPSLKKIVETYYSRIKKKKKLIDKYDKSDSVYKAGMLLNEPVGKIETKDGKVKGNIVNEGVLIEFYIKYKDIVGVGDKVTFFTALKSIVGETVQEGLEPYSDYRPDEEISAILAPGAVLARMTPSILLTMFGNKVLVELKRELYEIYYDKEWKNETKS